MSKRIKADLSPHQLVSDGRRQRYTVCDESWLAPPSMPCPGVALYYWSEWPEGFFTKRQLVERHLRPGPLRGAVRYQKARSGYLWLYKLDEATPAPAPTPAQIAASEQRRIGWRCTGCGGPLRQYVKGGGLCRHCLACQEATTWSREILADPRTVILDTETTGLALGSEILQIAVIDTQGNVLLDTYVYPEKLIDESGDACAINGITNAMIESAPRFPAMYERLAAVVKDRVVIIYNRGYDLPIINTLARRFGLPELAFAESACAMLMYAQFCGEWNEHYRSYRWQKLPSGDHSALGDCLATLDVLKEMTGKTEDSRED